MKCNLWKAPITGALAVGLCAGTMLTAFADSIQCRGSDTVLPLAQAWAEAYMKKHPGSSISVSGGGSGVGIAGLINGTTDVANASRPMKSSEKDKCKAKNFLPIEHKGALDGLSIIVHPDNPVKSLTVEQVGAMFTGKITNWKQVDASFPDMPLKLYGPGADSGTFENFTEAITGKAKASRGD